MQDLLQLAGSRHVSIWSSPGRGLWVASDGHFYRGMIERIDKEFVATDGHGRTTGRYASLDEAKMSIDSVIELTLVGVGA